MGGHGETHKPTKWHSIHDIPDSMVKTYSVRDPDNPFYKTRRWVNFKKSQILYTQNDGVPNHLRTPGGRFNYYFLMTSGIALAIYNYYAFSAQLNKKKT